MVSQNVTPTRHTLSETRDRLEMAYRGKTILERRRDRLVFLMSDLLERYRTQSDELEAAFEAATETRDRALELEGGIALRAAAEACDAPPELLFLGDTLEGLPVPIILRRQVRKRLDERGYGILGTSAAIDETADAYEDLTGRLVSIAELRLTLSVLLAEIRRTTVRVNALEHKLIPELEETRDYIEFYLEEREREERIRQLFFKRRLGRGVNARVAAAAAAHEAETRTCDQETDAADTAVTAGDTGGTAEDDADDDTLDETLPPPSE